MRLSGLSAAALVAAALATSVSVMAQDRPAEPGRGERQPGGDRGPGGERAPGGGGRGGFGGGGFGGGPSGFLRMNPVFAALDADEDGTISAKEIENATAALKKLDKDGDGKLNEEELRPSFGGGRGGFGGGPGGPGGPGGNPEEMVSRLMSMDKDKDGKLSKEEVGERMQSLLTRADTDKDGFASKAEIEALAKAEGGNAGGPPGGGRGGFGGNPEEMIARIFTESDKDKDGKLTGDEIPERMRAGLERIDTNKDKAIDKAELEAMFRSFGGGRGPGAGGQGGRPGEGGRGGQGGAEGRPARPAAE